MTPAESSTRWRGWRDAMQEALYGPAGFYRSAGAPGRHFRTSAHTSPAWTEAVLRLALSVDERLGRPPGFTLVDLGAGGGELLNGLAASAPEPWRLVGVDVAPRPPGLAARAEWRDVVPAGFDGLLLAVEWLDVVPVDCVELADDGVRVVEVNDDGDERLAGPPTDADLRWLETWWPLVDVGDRAEIGRPRDRAWAQATSGVRRGVAVAVDYAADPRRDVAGTLTGYRDGRQLRPVPDGTMDLTAHVLFESLADAESRRARLTSQRDALRELGVSADRPSYQGDPTTYLDALSRTGADAALLARGGLGDHRWLMIDRTGDEEA